MMSGAASNNSSQQPQQLQLCLTAVGHERQIVSLPKDATVEDLYQVAQSAFENNHNIQLKHGFPPRILECNSNNTTLESINVRHMDRIQVIVNVEEKQETNKTSSKKKKASSSEPPSRPRQQRAAAKAATESFGDVIRAQDKLMKEQQRAKAKRKRTTTMSSTTSTPRKQPKQPNLARLPGGRRLADGAAVESPSTTRKPSKHDPKFKSEQDVSEALLTALNHGGGGKVGHVLRGAMRNAVTKSYEASRALVKVAAVQSRNYTIRQHEDRLEVEYSKGLEGRGVYHEVVDCIPREALEAVITGIYQSEERELLQGVTLAQVSPRVFWSLIHLCGVQSVEDALQQLLPTLDWSHQTRRKTTLSAKAKENLLQTQGEDNGGVNIQAAEEAVHAVEDAMDQLSAYDASRRRDRAARAALARHPPSTAAAAVEWELVTPTEEDDDELMECIQSTNATDAESISKDEWKRILSVLHSLGIHNWRQLANANESEISTALNLPHVDAWIDYAQQQSIDELMVEICDNRVTVVEVLRDEARTGTPKDLGNWRHMPDLLFSSAPSLLEQGVQVSDVRTWCQRAQDVLQKWEWVHWYATPVE